LLTSHLDDVDEADGDADEENEEEDDEDGEDDKGESSILLLFVESLAADRLLPFTMLCNKCKLFSLLMMTPAVDAVWPLF
jgi:hypothetical protein